MNGKEDEEPRFILTQSEGYALALPRACFPIGGPRSTALRNDVMLVRLEPELDPKFDVAQRARPSTGGLLTHLFVMARFQGYGLSSKAVHKYPIPVYAMAIARAEALERAVLADEDHYRNFWAELYPPGADIFFLPHTKGFLDDGLHTEFTKETAEEDA